MPARPVDIEQVRAALESSLEQKMRSSLIEQISSDRESELERFYVKVTAELARQFRREINDLSLRTLAASEASMERRLEQLIRLIEAARVADHRTVARALYQIETNRLEDRSRLGEELENLGAIRSQAMPSSPTTN
jgi:hypothetical protein